MPAALSRLLAEAAPACPTAGQRSPGSPDRLAIATAARLILNAVSESVLTLGSPDAPPADRVASAVSLPELLRHFLSDDERCILRALANVPPGRRVTGSQVMAETGITPSEFWVLWSQLQVRGLVVQTGYSRTANYTLGVEWLRLLLN